MTHNCSSVDRLDRVADMCDKRGRDAKCQSMLALSSRSNYLEAFAGSQAELAMREAACGG